LVSMSGIPPRILQSTAAAIEQTFLLTVQSRAQISRSEALIASSLTLLQGQRIYPHHPMPPSGPCQVLEMTQGPSDEVKDTGVLSEP
jgi:hypothetical protein